MKKKHLKICNTSLLFIMPAVLASSVLLEFLQGKSVLSFENSLWVWLHVIMSCFMMVLIVWHISLNWQGISNWYRRFRTHKSQGIKFIAIFTFLTFVSGIIAVPLWLHCGHCGIGGLHGKIGFIAVLCMLIHIVKHRKWYSRR